YAAAENLVVLGESDLHDAQAALRMVLADDLAPLRKALVVAETQRLEAEGKLALLVAGTRQEEIDAAEAEIARLRAQRDYQAEQTFAGTVTSIATAVTGNSRAPTVSGASTATTPQSTTEGERTVLVTTRLDNTSHFLKPEMTGKAKIYCGGRSIFDLITRRLA